MSPINTKNLSLLALSAIVLSSCGGTSGSSSGFSSDKTSSSDASSSSEQVLPSGDSSSGDTSSESSSSSEEVKEQELLDDQKFMTGFYLKTPEAPVSYPRHFNYGGSVSDSGDMSWELAQWHTPYDFSDATETKVKDGVWKYENESRSFEVDTNTGEMSFSLDSWAEYQNLFGGSRTSGNQAWSHFLIEQTFSHSLQISKAKHLYLNLTFSIDELTAFDTEHYDSGKHAAQYLWYFTIQNILPDGADETKLGKHGDYLWFGVPLFDNRSDYQTEYKNIDAGFAGATNKLIYGMDNRNYLPVSSGHPLEIAKTYAIKDFDVLPYMQEAFIYGTQNGALENCQWGNMRVGYMNFGFELPGSFKMATTISGWSVRASYVE